MEYEDMGVVMALVGSTNILDLEQSSHIVSHIGMGRYELSQLDLYINISSKFGLYVLLFKYYFTW